MAAAMVNRMLDPIAALDPGEAAVLLDLGLVWPLGSVRRHALEILAAQGTGGSGPYLACHRSRGG